MKTYFNIGKFIIKKTLKLAASEAAKETARVVIQNTATKLTKKNKDDIDEKSKVASSTDTSQDDIETVYSTDEAESQSEYKLSLPNNYKISSNHNQGYSEVPKFGTKTIPQHFTLNDIKLPRTPNNHQENKLNIFSLLEKSNNTQNTTVPISIEVDTVNIPVPDSLAGESVPYNFASL